MQYSMYSTPLHGVERCLSGNTPARSDLKQLAICFSEVNLPTQLTPIWSRCDNGQRYSSQPALFRTQAGYILQVDCEGLGRFAKRVLKLPVTYCSKCEITHLSRIYLLNRIDANQTDTQRACEIRKVDASQALILPLQHSMLGNAYSALGLEASRVAVFPRWCK